MALIAVINNHTGDEGQVDETWLERWPDDFTPLSALESPAQEELPSIGTPNKEK